MRDDADFRRIRLERNGPLRVRGPVTVTGDDLQHEVIGPYLVADPGLDVGVAFGIHATALLEDRLAEFLPAVRQGGGSDLRIPQATSLPHH